MSSGQQLAAIWSKSARHLATARNLTPGLRPPVRATQHGPGNTFIVDWDAKFHYNFLFRRYDGDPQRDMDGNDATERDPLAAHRNATPMHPEYLSQALSCRVALLLAAAPRPAGPDRH